MKSRLLILLSMFAFAAACVLPDGDSIYPDDDDDSAAEEEE